ncbi:chloride channel protein [Lentilactobacillus senioris]|uniref:chloride channel protein n=1 Tax=Lentilactobacillus senioris TaxID=931534 RepID=UPI0022808A89|nr:chloride channel protein [Lentilactobacillus senioris]MCY9807395.1 chloride channel protein [Lentilactobacillus senioris]
MHKFIKELSYGILLGVVAALIVVLFTSLIHWGTWLLWEFLPEELGQPLVWPLIIGLTGGLIVGLLQKYVGPYPYHMQETLKMAKQPQFYRGKTWRNFVNAIVILIFGAGVGPEAALVAIVACFVVWINDRLQYADSNSEFLTTNGIGAVMALVFTNPFFGLSEQIDHEPAKTKSAAHYAVNIATILSAWLVFSTLQKFVSTPFFHLRFQHFNWSWSWLWAGLLAFILAEAYSWVYFQAIKPIEALSKMQKPIWLALLGGLILGLTGMWSSYLLFSGEESITTLLQTYSQMSVGFLIILGVGKMLLAIFYNAVGWRGGDIFPNIFGSICLGLAVGVAFGLPVVAVATVSCAVILTNIMQKPLLVCGLLILVLPLSLFPLVVISSLASAGVHKLLPRSESAA